MKKIENDKVPILQTDKIPQKFIHSRGAMTTLDSQEKSQTGRNFLNTKIFSKTAIDHQHSEFTNFEAPIKYSDEKKNTNFIKKNKQLGRVSDINKRRFSIMFNPNTEEKERIIRIKTMKRAAHTARMENRHKINNFIDGKDMSKAPPVESYKNMSVNEKRGINHKNPNALLNNIDPNTVYEKIIMKDKPTTAQAKGARAQSHFAVGIRKLRTGSCQRRPVTRQGNLEKAPVVEEKKEKGNDEDICIQSDTKGDIQFFTLFKKGLKRSTIEEKF